MKLRFKIRAGKGGDGCVSFRHLRRRPKGGPDGGDGGDGGDVILLGDRSVDGLHHLSGRLVYKAGDGQPGGGNGRRGRRGDDLILRVPVGTRISINNSLVGEISDGERIVAARGGRGGRGNMAFRSATNRLPDYAEPGRPGETRVVELSFEPKVDVIIIGKTNAGKSAVLRALTGAHPKVSPHAYTTRTISLGTLADERHRVVIGEIPARNIGAYYSYLKRAKLVIILLDASSSFEKDYHELRSICGDKDHIVVFNKIDMIGGSGPSVSGEECWYVSAKTGLGIQALKGRILEVDAA